MASKKEIAEKAIIGKIKDVVDAVMFELKDSETAKVMREMVTYGIQLDVDEGIVGPFDVFVENNGVKMDVIVFFKAPTKSSNYYKLSLSIE